MKDPRAGEGMKVIGTATFLSAMVFMCLGLMYVISTFDTHDWNSVLFGGLLGALGIGLALYNLMWQGEDV